MEKQSLPPWLVPCTNRADAAGTTSCLKAFQRAALSTENVALKLVDESAMTTLQEFPLTAIGKPQKFVMHDQMVRELGRNRPRTP